MVKASVTIQVHLIMIKGLDHTGYSDPYLVINPVEGLVWPMNEKGKPKKIKTKVVEQVLGTVFTDTKFTFPCDLDKLHHLSITCKDYNYILKNREIGTAIIPMDNYFNRAQRYTGQEEYEFKRDQEDACYGYIRLSIEFTLSDDMWNPYREVAVPVGYHLAVGLNWDGQVSDSFGPVLFPAKMDLYVLAFDRDKKLIGTSDSQNLSILNGALVHTPKQFASFKKFDIDESTEVVTVDFEVMPEYVFYLAILVGSEHSLNQIQRAGVTLYDTSNKRYISKLRIPRLVGHASGAFIHGFLRKSPVNASWSWTSMRDSFDFIQHPTKIPTML